MSEPVSKPAASAPSLFRAFATVGSYTMLSRVTGLVREILTSRFLGAGAVSDAFFVAFQLPNLFRSLFAEGAFSAGFVPIFAQRLERDGPEKAKEFADEAFAVLAAVLLVFSVLMMLVMPGVIYLMAPGFKNVPGQIERAAELARISFPYLFFVSLTMLQSGVLNAFHRYAAAAVAPVLLNITLVSALLIGVGVGGDRAVYLSGGVFAAGIVQFIWLAIECRRIGMRFKVMWPRFTPDVKLLLVRMLPVAFGAGIYQINILVNKAIASLAGEGAISWINYADRINLLPVGIFGTAIGIALLPLLARQIQAGNEQGALTNQNRAIEVSLLLTLPATGAIAILAGPIVSVLFEGGAFTPEDRVAVAAALMAFSIGLPAYVLNKALTPGFFGRHDTRTPVKASAASLSVNIALNLAFMPFLGHVGIALGTSIAAWLNAAMLSIILYRRGYLVPDARLKRRLPRVVLATLIMMAALWGGLLIVDKFSWALFGLPGVASGAHLTRGFALLVLIVGGGAVFAIAAVLFGAAQRSDLNAFRRNRVSPPPSA